MGQVDELVGEDVTWEGVATGAYWMHEGVERRLVVDHTLGKYSEDGVWQRDCECYVVG
jgi:hypothetical protein